MKIGIMQPYFFPYIGYFSLIDATDKWIVFDKVQFIRHGWIERNRVLNSNKLASYIKVPLEKHSRETKINHIYIRNSENWKKKILEQLTCYKKKAPYYQTVINFINEVLHKDFDLISELNTYILKCTCEYIGIQFNYEIFSKMNTCIETKIEQPGQWALEISKELKATTYVNPIGGKEIFNKSEFEQNGIDLLFLKNNLTNYNQRIGHFVEGLSIIDVLMYNSPKEALILVKDYKLEK